MTTSKTSAFSRTVQQSVEGHPVWLLGISAEVGMAELLEWAEAGIVKAALRRSKGNISRAARALHVHRNTARRRVKKLGIEPAEYKVPHG